MRKINISKKYILVSFVILLLMIGITAYQNASERGEGDTSGYLLSICRDGKVVKTVTYEELEKMPQVTSHVKLISTEKGNEEGDFGGVEVSNILDKNLLNKYERFIFSAGDGYSTAVSAKEIQKKDNVLIALTKDGKPLEHFKESGSGPIRLIITSDTYGNRSVKYLVRIECL